VSERRTSFERAAGMPAREPDRDQLEIFVDALLRHRGTEGFISLRSFYDDKPAEKKAARITAISLSGNFKHLIDAAEDEARRAAQHPRPLMFAPPLCVFNNSEYARKEDMLAGLVVSVELDKNPHEACRAVEERLGPATAVIRSGGQWIDGDGEVHDKLHAHWRLKQAARGAEDLEALEGARASAARFVNADTTNNPVCHPIRWPGSWHRKAAPRLCEIITVNPDVEIMLADARAALPPPRAVTRQAYTTGEWLTFLDDTYEGSSRGSAISRYAGLLMRTYLDPLIILSTVRLFSAQRCLPPLPDEEVERIVRVIAQRHAAQLNGVHHER
jgi:hypothetical protein